mgnify:CR=1 FL=1
MHDDLASFHPVLQQWFKNAFGFPTPPQEKGWPEIDGGHNVLLLAPTGSGKTLAAFFKCLDILYKKLLSDPSAEHPGVQILYVSPLKALNNDVYKNLQIPLEGISRMGMEMGCEMPIITTAVRTGDTSTSERRRMLRKPPHVLITTPESLFLMLSSAARNILKTIRFVIIDEIHSLLPNKRGCHLALSLERLQNLVGNQQFQRIGLSATIHPLDEAAKFLAGDGRDCTIIDSGQRKGYDLAIELPLPDLRLLPERSVWPAIYRKLHQLIHDHNTTLIFVNNRRQAERIAANLNQLAGEEIARTHHGSIAKEMRLESEELLKQGKIPCIVATSSLELGIDVGHIDLVVQIESPKEVARGIQRVGRAGHIVGLPSKARIIPKTRLDLLESVVMIDAIEEAAIERCHAPRNCLDILAQQLVAMTTEGRWSPEEMYAVCTRAYNYADLDWADFERVLQMLAGVYESDEAIDLKPRLQWDRLGNAVSMDSYGRQLVYSNSGTIPNRGYYRVYLGNGGPLLGELDEEFVYERRLGDRFLLGTTVWRIEELRQDRVIVSKPTGQGNNLPFWKGETVGRSFTFGERLGGFLREAESHLAGPDIFYDWLKVEDKDVAQTLYNLLNEQTRSTGKLPTDRCLVQEEFLGEMSDWHICIHSPFGTKLHALLALLISEQIQSEAGLKIEAFPADNGILLHVPGDNEPPQIRWASLLSLDLRDKIAQLISTTSLFGITFRHCAQRSLVMALLSYGKKRTPLWLSRLKASDLLQVVSKHQDFPLVMETYREILQDHFSISDLEDFLSQILRGEIEVHRVQTQTPSPFAREHLFNFVATQMYTDGTPASSSKRLFGLETNTLQEIFGKEGLGPELRDDAVAQVETRLQGRDALLHKPTLERMQYWLERVGDTTWEEVEECFRENLEEIAHLLEELLHQERAYRSCDGQIAATLHSRDYLALQGPNHTSQSKALRSIIVRYLRCHGPFSIQTLAERYKIKQEAIAVVLVQLEREGLLVQGCFWSQQDGPHWCSPRVLREIYALSLSKSRKDVVTADRKQYAVFLAQWQQVQNRNSAEETKMTEEPSAHLRKILHQFEELWLPVVKLKGLILPARWHNYSEPHLDQFLGSGLISWRAKQIGTELFLRFESSFTASDHPTIPTWVDCPVYYGDFLSGVQLSPSAERLVQTLQEQGALNLIQLSTMLDQSVSRIWSDLTELVLRGIVSNDTLGPLRLLAKWERHLQSKMYLAVESSVFGQMGRFFLLPQRRERSAAAQVQTLLDRYGIVTREIAVTEGLIWKDLYPIFDYLEHIDEVKRGYFVDGLGGIQFARRDAVERLNQTITDANQWWVLAKEDPAYPHQFSNDRFKAGSLMVFRAGKPAISAEKRKLALTILDELSDADLEQGLLFLLQALYPLYPNEKIVVSEVNRTAVTQCRELPILKRLGFELGYREAVLWPSERK